MNHLIFQKEHFLKCPLCAELHQIPKENGVAGFRKDFRIKNLIDQNEIKNPVVVSTCSWIPRDISQEEIISSDVDSESCSIHPGERLLYFCESSSCQMDICEKCWSCDHDTHIVKLLSKKVNDAKDVVQQEMDKTIQKINSQIDILINGSEKNDQRIRRSNDKPQDEGCKDGRETRMFSPKSLSHIT